MAFLDSRNKDRFSLLLLEPGEIYFEDFSAHIYRKEPNETISKWNLKGRLKICSKSVVFDPEDFSYPVLKFPLRDCETIEKWSGPLLSKLGNNLVHIKCRQVVHMLEGNVIAPYKFKKENNSFIFNLTYVKMDACLPQMCQLQRAATLPAADQAAMIAAIVMSRQSRVSFNTSWLEDLHENIVLETIGNRVTPLVLNPGRILLTNSRLYFQPFNNAEPDNVTWPVMKIKLCDIKRIIRRRFLLRQVGLEFYCNDSAPLKHLFLSFKSSKERNQLFMCMQDQSALQLEDTRQENMTLLWQNGVISNYDYLLYLNSLADRSFNDLTQYPVFPWVISQYTKDELDLDDITSYRDLTKPIGALNEERLQKLLERYKDMAEPRFLYGSHYSTPGFVLYYLVRQKPQYMLCLQYGRFDHPDRMFNSMQDTWRNVTHNSSDFKELIPQFYEPDNQGSFLVNSKDLHFGLRHNGQKVNDVELPPWAKNSPALFVSKLREALEGEYVSANLHHWIDLIYGYKQRGLQAETSHNVFYHLTYEGAVDLDNIKDLNERYSMEVQIMEFGQIPKQIFKYGHPARQLPSIMKELALNTYQVDGPNSNKSIFDEKVTNKERLERSNSCGGKEERRQSKTVAFKWKQNLSQLNFHSEYKLHKCEVTAVCVSEDLKTVFSVSQDTLLKMYSVEDKKQLRSVSISNLALSSCVLMEDGCKIIVGSWDNYVYIYNIEFGKVLGSTMAHDDAVVDISWNKGLLATASWDSTAKVWRYNPNDSIRHYHTGELLVELEHETGVQCVALNGSNTLLATGTNCGSINFWRLDNFILQLNVKTHSDVVEAISFSPDEQKVVSCGKDSTLKVLDVATGTLLFSKDAGEALICLCWDGITVLTGGAKGNLMVFDLIRACQICSIPAHAGPITCLDVSKGGEFIISGGKDGRVAIWEPAIQS